MASETKFKEEGTRLIPEDIDTNMKCKPWPVVEVQEVCDLIVDCVNKTAPTVDHITPYKMIRTTNIKSGKIDLSTCRYVEADTYERWTRRAKVKAGDVLLTREAPIGEVGYVICDDTTFLGQRIMQYRANPKFLDSRYLHYSFLSPALRYQFGMHEGSGSVVSHIRVGDCYKFKIPLPPLAEQAIIANILGTLDDKIDLNHQMNSNLEQIAQALFKRWFIDFEFPDENGDPYKSSGGRMVDSELGEIPEGWEVKTIDSIAKKIAMGPFGSNIKVSTFVDKGVPIISGQHLNETLLTESTYNYITEEHARKLANSCVLSGDVIFTHAGNIGQVSLIPSTTKYAKYIISQRQFYLRPDTKRITSSYLVYFFRSHIGQHLLLANASQVGVPSISRPSSYLKSIKIIVPVKQILNQFEAIIEAFAEQIVNNRLEIESLATIRDALLPKLMSGKIRVQV